MGNKKYIFYLVLFMPVFIKSVDFIIFSYDRPLQLYALLESTEKNVYGLDDTVVIYRTSNNEYEVAYSELKQRFDWVNFIPQNSIAEFKQLTLRAVECTSSPYIMFGVDDLIVTEKINLTQCEDVLKNNMFYAFYLRLGFNIDCTYPDKKLTSQPVFIHLENEIYYWHMNQGKGDWGYPNTVDMAIYRKNDILRDIQAISFQQPNQFEAGWVAGAFRRGLKQLGVCYSKSAVVNIPINRVQNVCCNHNMNLFSVRELLAFFQQGLKIDVDELLGMNNRCPHWDYKPSFIER